MRKSMTVGAVLLALVASCGAMTLGKPKGAVWIGQPLDLSIPVQLDPGSDSALCPEADVYSGDDRVEARNVRISSNSSAQAEALIVRVQTTVPLEEPVVTIYLRAGCNDKSTRRYVLLAELPPESIVNPVSVAITQAAAAENIPNSQDLTSAGQASPSQPQSQSQSQSQPKSKPQIQLRKPKPVQPAPLPAKEKIQQPSDAVALNREQVKPSQGTERGRLKLDPIENLSERIKPQETTPTPPPTVVTDEARKIEQLQADVHALLAQAAKNDADMAKLRAQLEKKESESVPLWIAYALGVLIALALGAIAWIWNRRSKVEHWNGYVSDYVVHPPTEEEIAAGTLTSTTTVLPDAVSSPRPQQPQKEAEDSGLDVNLMDDMDDETFSKVMHPSRPMPLMDETPTAHSTVLMPSTALRAEFTDSDIQQEDATSDEIYDLLQRAEFFNKLGKVDDAINTIEEYLSTHPLTSARPYLELLKITHERAQKTDFRRYREELRSSFNVNVPEFALFLHEGRNLENYPSLMERLQQCWDSREVIAVLDSSLKRNAWEGDTDAFDMAAFKDLVMLHTIAIHREVMSKNKPDLDISNPSTGHQHISLDF